MIHGLSSARSDQTDGENELNRISLQRICWFLVVIILWVAAIFTASIFFPDDKFPPATGAWIADTVGSLALLLTSAVLWRSPIGLSWRKAFVILFLLVQLATADYYFLSLFPVVGPTTVYVLTLLCVGVVLLITPKAFSAILIGNHIIYVILVLHADMPPTLTTVALIDGSVGVGLSCLCQFLLYTGKKNDIARRLLLKQKAEEIDTIMAITAHDLRSPLQSLKNLYDATSQQAEWQQQPYLSVQRQSSLMCRDMLHMIDGILMAHRAEQSTDLNPITASLRQFLEDAMERAELMAKHKNIAITLSPAPDRMMVNIDQIALQKVLDNLLSNALKFSPPNTAIMLSVTSTGLFYAVDIADEGPGIPEEERDRLFEKFRQGRNKPTGAEASYGLGLYIAKAMMQSMGGRLEYRPRHPRGSIFTFSVPKAHAERSE